MSGPPGVMARHGAASRSAALTVALLVWLTALGQSAAASDTTPLIEQAIEHYQRAQGEPRRDARLAGFGLAADLFAEAARRTTPRAQAARADLHANAGTSALQAERLGQSILELRRALALDPDHTRARRNLGEARQLLPEWLPRERDTPDMLGLSSWLDVLSRPEQLGLAALLFVLAAALLGLSMARGTALPRWLGTSLLLAWAVVLGASHAGARQSSGAAVLLVESVARAADSANAPARFARPLPAGTEVLVLDSRAGWSRVRLADRRDAWLRTSALEALHTAA